MSQEPGFWSRCWVYWSHRRFSRAGEDVGRDSSDGWNSWNKFGCHVSEDLIRQMADAMVKSGMKDAGYQYIVIDDCWQVERDPSGNIVPDPKTFPRNQGPGGLCPFAGAQVWNLFGWRGQDLRQASRQPGPRISGRAAVRRLGRHYLKYDWCNTSTQDAEAAYALIRMR